MRSLDHYSGRETRGTELSPTLGATADEIIE
jgi:hypothetical protein